MLIRDSCLFIAYNVIRSSLATDLKLESITYKILDLSLPMHSSVSFNARKPRGLKQNIEDYFG